MYYLNKIIGYSVTPVGMAFVLLIIGLLLNWFKRRGCCWAKGGQGWMIAAAVWLWLWSTPLMSYFVGATLEHEFLINGQVLRAESYPKAEAILLLGGSMGVEERLGAHAEMWGSADRVWRAVELYKAGKAPKIYVTGGKVEMSTAKLLVDLGVPREAVVFDESPRNTEEEAKAAAKRTERKVLVVTSAWHMKRARLMFEKYAPDLEVFPAPRDFENTMGTMNVWSVFSLLPNPTSLMWNSISFHEWIGLVGYKVFR